jgi:hypothetical protein
MGGTVGCGKIEQPVRASRCLRRHTEHRWVRLALLPNQVTVSGGCALLGMRGGGLGLHPLTALQREFMDIALPGASEILLILRLYNSIESLHVCD